MNRDLIKTALAGVEDGDGSTQSLSDGDAGRRGGGGGGKRKSGDNDNDDDDDDGPATLNSIREQLAHVIRAQQSIIPLVQ